MPEIFPNSLKRRMLAGERLVGGINFSGSPKLVEVCGVSGLDFLILDTEHTDAGWSQVEAMVRAGDAVGLPTLVRLGAPDQREIARALDAGAQGIVISHVATVAKARDAATYSKYAPQGCRGACSAVRATRYGQIPWTEYVRAANDSTLVICLIEDLAGLDQVAAIAAVPGVDALWCGAGDLSQALGIPYSGIEHPAIAEAVGRIAAACRAEGKAMMLSAGGNPTPDSMRAVWQAGAALVSLGPDVDVIRRAYVGAVTSLRDAAISE